MSGMLYVLLVRKFVITLSLLREPSTKMVMFPLQILLNQLQADKSTFLQQATIQLTMSQGLVMGPLSMKWIQWRIPSVPSTWDLPVQNWRLCIREIFILCLCVYLMLYFCTIFTLFVLSGFVGDHICILIFLLKKIT